MIAALALSTVAWAQTAGSHTGASQQTGKDFDQQQSISGGQLDQSASNHRDDWYQRNLNPFVDQFIRVNNSASPMTASLVDQQDQFNGARPGAMASNASGEQGNEVGQGAMAGNAGGQGSADQGRSYWFNRKVQADAEVNRRNLAAIRHNPNLNSADVE